MQQPHQDLNSFNNSIWLVRLGFALVGTLAAGMMAAWGMMLYDGMGTLVFGEPVANENYSEYLPHALPYMVGMAAAVYIIVFLIYRAFVKTLET